MFHVSTVPVTIPSQDFIIELTLASFESAYTRILKFVVVLQAQVKT